MLALTNCAKLNSSISVNTPENNIVIEKPLVPTEPDVSAEADTAQTAQIEYEPLPTEIKTPTATLKLGLTKFTDINYVYDTKTQKAGIHGQLKIYDSNQTMITEIPFDLNGILQKNQSVIQLNQKNSAAGLPIVGAKVTCLGLDKSGDSTCDKAIVDFFVFYKNQYFTDQFETKNENSQKKTPSTPPPVKNVETPKQQETTPVVPETKSDTPTHTPPVTPAETTPENEPDSESDLQVEGNENSIQGRYQGQAETTDVNELLQIETPPAAVPSTPSAPTTPTAEPKKIAPPKAKEVSITPDIKQTKNGNLVPQNQAIGAYDKGVLKNATSIKALQGDSDVTVLFKVSKPAKERFYSTYDMYQIFVNLGSFLNLNLGNLKLYIGDISAKRGGQLGRHLSHQIGMDADLAYPTKTLAESEKNNFPVVVTKAPARKYNPAVYSVEKTYELFKHAFKQTDTVVDRIFVDRRIIKDLCMHAIQKNEFKGADKDVVQKLFQNIQHVDGHGDHFHLRIKCGPSQPACRPMRYTKMLNCHALTK